MKMKAWMVGLLSIVTFFGVATQANAVTCPIGAEVADRAMCGYFYHFGSDDATPDPRITSRLQLQSGDRSRSIALIIGISRIFRRRTNSHPLPMT